MKLEEYIREEEKKHWYNPMEVVGRIFEVPKKVIGKIKLNKQSNYIIKEELKNQ